VCTRSPQPWGYRKDQGRVLPFSSQVWNAGQAYNTKGNCNLCASMLAPGLVGRRRGIFHFTFSGGGGERISFSRLKKNEGDKNDVVVFKLLLATGEGFRSIDVLHDFGTAKERPRFT